MSVDRTIPRADRIPRGEPDGALPDAESFGRTIVPSSPRHRSLEKLHALLVACRPSSDLAERVDAIEALTRWLASKRRPATPPDGAPGDSAQVQRLRLLLRALELVPVFRQRVAF